jgi:16S rRNA (adenine1518-N6/adenine1519-N6)-dimethyltransferase
MVYAHGIKVKKQYGQHFLRDHSVIDSMIASVDITSASSVCEIGCGEGILTRAILKTSGARLWVFEIDPEWATYVRNQINDQRLTIFVEDVLDLEGSRLVQYAPWVLLANLPYQVTFPILHMIHAHRHLFKEGVIMVQEEVAQKIVKTTGRGYGYISLFFQYYFEWELLDKIPAGAFYPPPSVMSRLLYFKPKTTISSIVQEHEFWRFIKMCFRYPRRTLNNNLLQTHFNRSLIPSHYLSLRAQQMKMDDFLMIWQLLCK